MARHLPVHCARACRDGATLVELLLSMAIMTILMGTVSAAMFVAARSLPNGKSVPEVKVANASVLDRIARELTYATTITTAGADEVDFTVADRGHGLDGPEAIHYAWSGTAGDPLTRQYNGGTVIDVLDDVEDFDLDFTKQDQPLQGLPHVLLVVGSTSSPSTQDVAKLAIITSWGFPVQMIDDDAPMAAFTAAIAVNDVIYTSEEVFAATLQLKVENATIGLVSEVFDFTWDLGFASNGMGSNAFQIGIIDDDHFITSGLPIGNLDICTSSQELTRTAGALAAGADVLADLRAGAGLVVIEVDGTLRSGGDAPGRRVKLPWGKNAFDIMSLTNDGLQIMRRAIVWAAAPVAYTDVRIAVESTSEPATRMETEVVLLNRPLAQ